MCRRRWVAQPLCCKVPCGQKGCVVTDSSMHDVFSTHRWRAGAALNEDVVDAGGGAIVRLWVVCRGVRLAGVTVNQLFVIHERAEGYGVVPAVPIAGIWMDGSLQMFAIGSA